MTKAVKKKAYMNLWPPCWSFAKGKGLEHDFVAFFISKYHAIETSNNLRSTKVHDPFNTD